MDKPSSAPRPQSLFKVPVVPPQPARARVTQPPPAKQQSPQNKASTSAPAAKSSSPAKTDKASQTLPASKCPRPVRQNAIRPLLPKLLMPESLATVTESSQEDGDGHNFTFHQTFHFHCPMQPQ